MFIGESRMNYSSDSGKQKAPGDFFQRVYRLVACIPPGQVATYGQIAAILGSPRAARTVGWAMQAAGEGVPCHRVVNASGALSPRKCLVPGCSESGWRTRGFRFFPAGGLTSSIIYGAGKVQTRPVRSAVFGETVNRQDSSARSGVIPALNTAHLLLRPFRPEDAAPLYQILNQPGLLQYFPDPTPPSLERVERFIGKQLTEWQERGYALWAVQPLQTDRLAGWCGSQFLPETGETEVAYLLGRECWGRGYATEAAHASLDFTFRHFPLDQIIALVHPDNASSIRVIGKLGMKSSGLAPYFGVELERFELTRSAWQKQIEKK